jgi:SAM-dependent methyltransferase
MAEPRPLYHRFAWAYDLLLDEPIDARVDAIAALLAQRGVLPPSRLLDAGCGTGRYASALAHRGFHVVGVDRSPDLVKIAQTRSSATTDNVEYLIGEFTVLREPGAFAGILCRGVLNDLLTDTERELVALRFAELLIPGGVLLLDVRDWLRTTERYRAEPSTARVVALAEGGSLIFRSQTSLESLNQQMSVSETLELSGGGTICGERHTNEFRMRCWSADELCERFGPWFEDVEILPDYVTPPAWTDRLVFIAARRRSSGA